MGGRNQRQMAKNSVLSIQEASPQAVSGWATALGSQPVLEGPLSADDESVAARVEARLRPVCVCFMSI